MSVTFNRSESAADGKAKHDPIRAKCVQALAELHRHRGDDGMPSGFAQIAGPVGRHPRTVGPARQAVKEWMTAEKPKSTDELIKKGMAAIPALLAALERRDVELRQHAVEVLQSILQHAIPFDAFAPEAERKHQLAALRELFERKAG